MSDQPTTPDGAASTSMVDASTGAPATGMPVTPNAPSQPAPTDPGAPPSAASVGVNPTADMASNLPSPGPTDLPRFQRTAGGILKSMLLGLVSGGIPGAVVGAASPTAIQKRVDQEGAFHSAQAAMAISQARQDEVRSQNLPEQLQDAHQAAADQHVKQLISLYGAPTAVFDNTPEAAHEALKNAAANGGVPLTHFETVGDKTYAFNAQKAADNSNALTDINRYGILSGQPQYTGMTSDDYDQMAPQDKADLWHRAQSQLMPVTPDKDNVTRAGQIAETTRELNTVKSLPDGPTKEFLLNKTQNDFDRLADADDAFTEAQAAEDKRKAAEAGAQASAKLPSELALENAKAANKAAAANPGDEWKPKITSDEKKKAELGENIAENANAVASILQRRPDLVGTVAGRFTNVQQMAGNNDPDISALATRIHNIAMANSSVHGFRSQEGVADTEQRILNGFKNGPRAVAGALKATTDSVQTFVDDARPEGYKTHSKQGGAVRGMWGGQ